ncbi:MAG: 4Fe-4S dicluster domain-containing protein [Verrucomicrobia bacterium]|nr:4Fe-4S dicluster domain-containing protein [Verrucomicrobiota bacterium]
MLGTGIIKGLVETARNFTGSYHDPARLTTVQYPEEKHPLPENARNFPFLVHDGDDPEKGLRCVACLICEKECPPQCIYIVAERDEKGKVIRHPKLFDIDISVCMSCQICLEVCPFDAIKMDTEFELSKHGRFEDLLLHKQQLAKSNDYYRQIHPTEAAEVDARLAEAKAKQTAKVTPAKPVGQASSLSQSQSPAAPPAPAVPA